MLLKMVFRVDRGSYRDAADRRRTEWFNPADLCRARMVTVGDDEVLQVEARGEAAKVEYLHVYDPPDVATLNRKLAKLAAEPVLEALQRYGAARQPEPEKPAKPQPDPAPPTKPAPVPKGDKPDKPATNDPPVPA